MNIDSYLTVLVALLLTTSHCSLLKLHARDSSESVFRELVKQDNMRKIDRHNMEPNQSFRLEANQFI